MVKVALALLATANAATQQATLSEIADSVNAAGVSWKAAAPEKFASIEEVKPYLGAILKGEEGYKAMAKEVSEVPNVDVPAEFDVRTAFPDCAEVSGNIRDQSSCGSCWAFGSTEAFNDRHCIATGSKVKFSVEDTTANCGFMQCFSMGCNGGQPGMAWDWFQNTGVVTGGDYFDIGAGDTCAPYTLAPCAHHVPATEKYPACPSSEYDTPSLSECSESAYGKQYSDDKIKATDSYSLNGIAAIQADMVQYGSATAAFTVYDDFPTYKSGVYKRTSNNQLGGHAVKLLGWGTENGEDYWLVANSWNEQWGDHGTFKIARGNNECGIEGQVSAGRAGSAKVDASAPDCTQATCQSQCECSLDKCATEIDACLADATCAKSQDCAFACACSDNACLLKCAASSPSLKALPVAKCINSNCASTELVATPDCTQATCQAQCECSLDKCATEIDACLADATCAKSQDCAFACACSDNACLLKCAASSPSLKALPVAKCINSNCASAQVSV